MDTCPRLKSTERTNEGNSEAAKRMYAVALAMRCFWSPRRKRSKKKKQELKVAGEC